MKILTLSDENLVRANLLAQQAARMKECNA
ncbi:hypothetical protein LCEOLIKB_01343 [Aeromonas hydrophila]